MRGERAGFGWDLVLGSAARGVSRRRVAAHSIAGLSEPWLRAIVIFALIHRPILPLSFVALFAQ
jgi:hypothetical protein